MAYKDHLAVAAIDFGTTFSGWAYSFRDDFEREPTQVFSKNWNSGESMSPKTPTAVLIRPDGKTLEAFGYEAENKYITLTEEDDHGNYYFFYRFKMMLYKQKLMLNTVGIVHARMGKSTEKFASLQHISRTMTLETDDGKQLPAMLVFKLAICYLKDDLMKEIGDKIVGGLTVEDIHWTLTVPTIWSERAKKFMREAAIKAGIRDRNLTIVLEPESASIFCQHLPLERSFGGHMRTLDVGSVYILIDCGGGTTDICFHRILEDRKLQELYRSDGEAIGGADVDQAFEQFLVMIFGQSVWREFKQHNGGDVLSLFRSFEVKKREMKTQGNDPVTFSLPSELVNILQSQRRKNVQEAVLSARLHDNVNVLRGNKIRIKAVCLRNYVYGDVVERFRSVLMNASDQSQLSGVETVLMVGGFSESPIIQDVVRQTFPVRQVITIQEPSLAVVKGAVIYGHDESVVQTRIARFTYGIGYSLRLDANIHDESKAYVGKDGVKRVRLFEPIVKAGQELPADEEKSGVRNHPAYEDQSNIAATIYAVDEEDDIPTYEDDPRCIKLGKLTAPITNTSVPRKDRRFELKLKFGGTEIKATYTELLTGNIVEANIDFLG